MNLERPSSDRGAEMKNIFSKTVLCTLLAATGISTSAAPQWCQGTVGNLWIYTNGNVYVVPSFRGDHIRICNMNTETSGISVINCVAWFTMLRNAMQRQSTVTVYYPEAPSCNTLPTYDASPVPGYVMQRD